MEFEIEFALVWMEVFTVVPTTADRPTTVAVSTTQSTVTAPVSADRNLVRYFLNI